MVSLARLKKLPKKMSTLLSSQPESGTEKEGNDDRRGASNPMSSEKNELRTRNKNIRHHIQAKWANRKIHFLVVGNEQNSSK